MLTKLIRIALFVLPLITVVIAQPSFPGEPDQAPIGGLGLLAAAGGALAVKKLMDKRKK
ncbi:MAG TPA: hypothetical protein QF602_09860 [Candidatus Marinimicrobia bacterium]|jgi:hypothetical protein|nr:hypothetical protein [Candidatus Neomarinimicrobiota bacterium]